MSQTSELYKFDTAVEGLALLKRLAHNVRTRTGYFTFIAPDAESSGYVGAILRDDVKPKALIWVLTEPLSSYMQQALAVSKDDLHSIVRGALARNIDEAMG